MAPPDDAVADGGRRRTVIWVIIAIGVGLGLTAGSGSVVDGTGTTAAIDEAIVPALLGSLVGIVAASVAVWVARRRIPRGVRGRDVALVIVVVGGCIGALIGAGSVGDPPADAPRVEQNEQDAAGDGGGSRATGGLALGPERSENNLDDATGIEVTIVLLVGLALLLRALWFFAKQVDREPVEPGVGLLEGREIFDEIHDEGDAESVATALQRSLDSLRASDDPRDSILASYASLLAELELVGLGRRVFEGPMEHVSRCLADAQLPRRPVSELAELFARARFGARPMTTADRDAAQRALVESLDLLSSPASTVAGSGE